ncbi:MAG: hypothetical protein A3K00_09745 [Gallionellales bacterium RIFOXYD2_FULL_52_7]|nr:MAG: hypothetical protein A3K00_09745 [Gallionellales bacterium RIFOXYD2_FULL_52_7]
MGINALVRNMEYIFAVSFTGDIFGNIKQVELTQVNFRTASGRRSEFKILVGDGCSLSHLSRAFVIIIRDMASVNQFVLCKRQKLIYQRIEMVTSGDVQAHLMMALILLFLTSNSVSCQAEDPPVCCCQAYQGKRYVR